MKQSFNPNARWDRHIPESSDAATPETLNERIDVLAWFRNGKAYPRLFVWNNKKYKINKTTYTWQEHRGQELINYFSVSCGIDLYQISFRTRNLTWHLDKII